MYLIRASFDENDIYSRYYLTPTYKEAFANMRDGDSLLPVSELWISNSKLGVQIFPTKRIARLIKQRIDLSEDIVWFGKECQLDIVRY